MAKVKSVKRKSKRFAKPPERRIKKTKPAKKTKPTKNTKPAVKLAKKTKPAKNTKPAVKHAKKTKPAKNTKPAVKHAKNTKPAEKHAKKTKPAEKLIKAKPAENRVKKTKPAENRVKKTKPAENHVKKNKPAEKRVKDKPAEKRVKKTKKHKNLLQRSEHEKYAYIKVDVPNVVRSQAPEILELIVKSFNLYPSFLLRFSEDEANCIPLKDLRKITIDGISPNVYGQSVPTKSIFAQQEHDKLKISKWRQETIENPLKKVFAVKKDFKDIESVKDFFAAKSVDFFKRKRNGRLYSLTFKSKAAVAEAVQKVMPFDNGLTIRLRHSRSETSKASQNGITEGEKERNKRKASESSPASKKPKVDQRLKVVTKNNDEDLCEDDVGDLFDEDSGEEDDVEEDSGEDVEEDSGQDVDEDLFEDVEEDVSEGDIEDVSEDDDEDLFEDVNEDLAEDVAEDLSEDDVEDLSEDDVEDLFEDVEEDLDE